MGYTPSTWADCTCPCWTGRARPAPALQDEPDIDGDIVVWEDWRNNPNPIPVYANEFHNSDIYMKDLSTGDTTQLTDLEGMEIFPRVQGNRVFFTMADGNGGIGIFMIELGN